LLCWRFTYVLFPQKNQSAPRQAITVNTINAPLDNIYREPVAFVRLIVDSQKETCTAPMPYKQYARQTTENSHVSSANQASSRA